MDDGLIGAKLQCRHLQHLLPFALTLLSSISRARVNEVPDSFRVAMPGVNNHAVAVGQG